MVLDQGEQAIHDEARQARLDSYIEKLASQETIGARFQMLVRRIAKRAMGIIEPEAIPSAKTMDKAFDENKVVSVNLEKNRFYSDYIQHNSCTSCIFPEVMLELNDEFQKKIDVNQQTIDEITKPKPADNSKQRGYKFDGWMRIQ